ncbi:MAG: MBL fold metallo-hydrolase [Defluviitaleaceae bacterium]|nr:MBL fold metallo-hydrolase [Defluviitaleaceae bacterium]
MRFCTIVSGSSGNCTYVGGLLVDAGLSGKRIQQGLSTMKLPNPSAILITHEHSDHITSAGILARRFNIPVYATPLTWRYFLRHNKLGALKDLQMKHIIPEEPTIINDITVTAFDVSHDASQPVGYTFEANGKKIALATDLGKPTDTVLAHMEGANILLIESNHDIEMLENGPYHRDLKERVKGSRGHLSNVSAGQLIVNVAWEGLKHVILGHLSEENNAPMLAFDTVGRILDAHNIKVQLRVADRYYPGEMIEI